MTAPRPPLVVTMGDPTGCGPQITRKLWAARHSNEVPAFFVVADPRVYGGGTPVETIESPNQTDDVFTRALPVLPIEIERIQNLQVGKPCPDGAQATIESITRATQLCLTGEASAMVTNPISKSVLYRAGFSHPGHTEFIADLCAAHSSPPIRPVMMLIGGGLRVALATIHIPLMRVAEYLTPTSLSQTAAITHHALIRDFGLSAPRIAFTGLNPHAGEDGSIGIEEQDLINPIAAHLRADGIDITDARSADTVFHEALNGQFDAIIAMTHDQGLIPVKTLDMWGGVNTTLGLPIIRTSPDHGTAYEAAAAGTSRPDSLLSALKLARDMTLHRIQHDG